MDRDIPVGGWGQNVNSHFKENKSIIEILIPFAMEGDKITLFFGWVDFLKKAVCISIAFAALEKERKSLIGKGSVLAVQNTDRAVLASNKLLGPHSVKFCIRP